MVVVWFYQDVQDAVAIEITDSAFMDSLPCPDNFFIKISLPVTVPDHDICILAIAWIPHFTDEYIQFPVPVEIHHIKGMSVDNKSEGMSYPLIVPKLIPFCISVCITGT